MAGPVIRAGHYDPDAAAGLAVVESANQRAYSADTRVGVQDVIWYRIGGRVGSYGGGSAVFRWGVMDTTTGLKPSGGSGRVPRNRLAQTQEATTSVGYTGAGEGETRFINLTAPFASSEQNFAFAATCRSGNLTQGMTPAASLGSSHNTGFYDRSIPAGTTDIQNGYSSISNQGHEVIWMEGEANVAPGAPTISGPGGTISTLVPAFIADFNDANKVLQNGVAWDQVSRFHIQLRVGSDSGPIIWEPNRPTSDGEKSAHLTGTWYDGPELDYFTSYYWRIRHCDRLGEWGTWSPYWAFGVNYTGNRKPSTPGAVVQSGGISNRQPTMKAAFSDPDETLSTGQAWDYIQASRHEIWWGSQSRWDQTFASTPAERAGRYSERQIGVLVPFDTPIVYFVHHQDRGGLWSVSRRFDFEVLSGASVDKPTLPSGRVTNLSNPGAITSIYRSSGGLSTNAVIYQLRDASGNTLKTSGYLPRIIAPNGVITDSWANAALGSLSPGTEYQITIQARDSNNNWSPVSQPTVIVTNAQPNTPIVHSPPDGYVSSSLNHAQVIATDPDQPQIELVATLEIRSEDGTTILGTVPMDPHPSAANRFWKAPSSIITGYQTFTWRTRTNDGYLNSEWSPLTKYVYAAVPAVTITGPVSTISTSQPNISWTSTGQTHWRVQLRDEDGVLVYDTGDQVGGAQSHTISGSQYWINGERWNRDETFDLSVMVRDASTLWGTSAPLTLTLEYDPPPVLILDGGAEAFPGVKGTHFIRLSVQQSEYPQVEFEGYAWTRVAITGENGAVIPGTEYAPLVSINSSETMLEDFDVTSNQWYRYSVTQRIRAGVDIIESDPVIIDVMARWHGTLLHMPFDPLNNHVWLPYGTERYEPEVEWSQGAMSVLPAGARTPFVYGNGQDGITWNLESTLIPYEGMTTEQQRDAFRQIWRNQNYRHAPNGRPNSVCFREGRGGDDGRVYGRVSQAMRRHAFTRVYTIGWTFSEHHFVLGMPTGGDQ